MTKTNLGAMNVQGVTGNYEFTFFPWDTTFNAVGAVYVITRRNREPDGSWAHTILYVGQTENLSAQFERHYKEFCFTHSGANCICIHADSSKSSRLRKERDLVSNRKLMRTPAA